MSKYPQGKYERHFLNVPGPFYVEEGQCINCEAPLNLATDLFGFFLAPPDVRGCNHCYVKKQPATPGEMDRMVQAMVHSCCGAVRYCGDDAAVLQKLTQAGYANRCDELSDEPVAASPQSSEE